DGGGISYRRAGSDAEAGPLRVPAADARRPDAAQLGAATGAFSSAGQVAASTAPVTGRLWEAWKLRTACWVPAPYDPSTPMLAPAPLRCSCAHTTRSPLAPRASVAHAEAAAGAGPENAAR